MRRISINIPDDMYIRLKLEALLLNITLTKYVNRIIFQELKRVEKIREED